MREQHIWAATVLLGAPLLLVTSTPLLGDAATPMRSTMLVLVTVGTAVGAARNAPTIPIVGWLLTVLVAANALNGALGLQSLLLVLLGFAAALIAILVILHTRRHGFGPGAALDALVATSAPFALVLGVALDQPLPADGPLLLGGNFVVLHLVVISVSQPYEVPRALILGLIAITMSTVTDLSALLHTPVTDRVASSMLDLQLLVIAATTLHPTFAHVTSTQVLTDQRHRAIRLLVLAVSLTLTLLLLTADARALLLDSQALAVAPLWLLLALITWRIFEWIRALSTQAAMEREASEADPLTGLRSAQGLRSLVRDHAQSPSTGWSMIALDIDRFRLVNEAFGTDAGDAALKAIAERVQALVPPDGALARLTADEFAVLLPGTDRARAKRLARAVVTKVGEPMHAGDMLGWVSLRASAGVAVDEDASAGDDLRGEGGANGTAAGVVDRLMRDSLTAVSHAQRHTHRPVEDYVPEMAEQAAGAIERLRDLQRALAPGSEEIQPALQPIVDLATGRTVAVEALARLTLPDGRTVAPDQFLPLAEASGWIVQLGRRMLRRSCEDLLSLRQQDPDLRLHVNVSPIEAAQPGYVEATFTTIDDLGLPLDAVVLEVTERVLLPNASEALTAFIRLAGLGVGLSLDDFGSGYASIGYLSRLPLETIKIDRSFIAEMGDPDPLIDDLVPFLTARGAVLIAEGVETAEQLQRMKALGCPLAQGYHLGRPVPAADLHLHPVIS